MTIGERERVALVSEAAGIELLRHTATLLNVRGIQVVPLKGIWLQRCVYANAGARAITDVDVLVREPDYAAAREALIAAGFKHEARNASEAKLTHPAFRLPLDLHRRLFLPGVFRLSTSAVFARAHPDRTQFSVDVMLPDPLDVFAHLVGHFVKSRTPRNDRDRLGDFVAIAYRCRLDPHACARHLDSCGLARAARYVLAAVAEFEQRDAFSAAVVDALAPDRVGAALVRCASLLAEATDETSPLGALPGFMLEASLVNGGASLLRRACERAWVLPRSDREPPAL